jgi:hypothetical protein
MPTYLPFYSRGDYSSWASDPSCVFALGLNKDGPTFRSDDLAGHVCTKAGALWRPLGHFFDGTDDKINVPTFNTALLTNSFSLCAWVNVATAAHHQFIMSIAYDYSTKKGILLFVHSSNSYVTCNVSNGTLLNAMSIFVVVRPIWDFYAVTYNGATITGYLNGVKQSPTAALAGPISWTTGALFFGDTSQVPHGSIALPKIYNRVLSQTEILATYEREKSIFL